MEAGQKNIGELIENNQRIVTSSMEEVTLDYLISGNGGQGDVYHVTYRNHAYAMKWYCKNAADVIGSDQHATIAKLSRISAPSDKFVWPVMMVTEENPAPGKRFGYLMELIPSGYYEMKDFLRDDRDPKAVRFKSYHAMLMAGMNIVSGMQKLHLKGLSYKDLNPNNFAFEPATGEVLIIDNDNVSEDGDKCTVKGMKGYMAPEIPRSQYQKDPGTQTDYFSLAIILYRLFFIDHPMEGKRWDKYPMCTDKVEDYLYAIKPVFNFDPKDDSNRPSGAYAPNAMQRWIHMPVELRQEFVIALTEGIDEPGKRPPENAWIRAISKARDKLIRLNPEREQFVNFDDKRSVPPRCLEMKIGSNRIALYPGKAIYEIAVDGNVHTYGKAIGGIVYNKQVDKFMIRNLSDQVWRGFSPETKQLTDIRNGQNYPIAPGVMIEFQKDRPKIIGQILDAKQVNG